MLRPFHFICCFYFLKFVWVHLINVKQKQPLVNVCFYLVIQEINILNIKSI